MVCALSQGRHLWPQLGRRVGASAVSRLIALMDQACQAGGEHRKGRMTYHAAVYLNPRDPRSQPESCRCRSWYWGVIYGRVLRSRVWEER